MSNETIAPAYTGYAVVDSENRANFGLHGESLFYDHIEIAKIKWEESGGAKIIRVDIFPNGKVKKTDVTPQASQ
ncbi:MAG: hypothetical protein WCD76_10010 [Pyrinomonadaceae bacterium]